MLTMLDLQKYLRRAEADPSFRKRLLQDANRAIKDEFGEDLPYALKCKEKLSFEVESMDGYNDEDLKGVAGGSMVPPGSKGLVRRKYNFNFDPNYEVTPTGNNVNFIHGDNMAGRLERAKRLLNSGSNNS